MPSPRVRNLDFSENPFVVIWETTRACALRCVHCRAEAIDRRSPGELSTEEAYALLREIRRFGDPLVVLTGGDPLRRPDILEIVRYAAGLGLQIALTPSATPEAGRDKLEALRNAGLTRLAVSLDGPTASVHDAFRQVEGSFDWTLRIMRWANELGIPLQINTTVSRHNLHDFDAIARRLGEFSLALWSVFFVVPTGRADAGQLPTAGEWERVFERMAELARTGAFPIKSTEAPQYRRVVLQQARLVETAAGHGGFGSAGRPPEAAPRPIVPVNDGKGFVFISHLGEVFPSGFLPVAAGNVKSASLVELYRNSDLFRSLRDPSKLKGKCGACEYKTICGGSRARAFAVRGDVLAADPFCVHVPKGYAVTEEDRKFW